MKRLTQDAGKVRDLSAPYQQQLNSYALAAAAAGSLLALAQKSEARIIYPATHRGIADGDSYSLDFTGNGTTDLTLGNKYRTSCGTEGTCWRFQSLIANLAGSNQAVRNVSGAMANVSPGQSPSGALLFSSESQSAQRGGLLHAILWAFGFTGDDAFVGDGFVGISGQGCGDGQGKLNLHAQPCPPVLDLALDLELHSRAAVLKGLSPVA